MCNEKTSIRIFTCAFASFEWNMPLQMPYHENPWQYLHLHLSTSQQELSRHAPLPEPVIILSTKTMNIQYLQIQHVNELIRMEYNITLIMEIVRTHPQILYLNNI